MKNEKFILGILASINFTHIVDVMIMMPLGDIVMRLFDVGPEKFSLLVSAYAFGAFLSSLLGAVLIDRYDRKKALLFVYTGFALGTLLCAVATSYYMLFCIRFITGLFGGMISALVLSVVSDIFRYERRGAAMGVLTSAFSVAAALGVPIGLYLASAFSWEAPFIFVGSLGLTIVALIAWRFPSMKGHLTKDKPAQRPNPLEVFRVIARDRNQINALLLGIIIVLGHMIIIPFIAPYMRRNVGFEQSQITYIYALGGLLTAFTSPYIGRLTDRWGPMKTFFIVMSLSFIPVLALTNLPSVPIPLALVVTSAFFVFGSGRMIAPQTMITAAVGPEGRGGFMSVKAALQQLGIALASIIGGWIISEGEGGSLQHYGWAGLLSVTIGVIAIWMGTRLKVADGN